VVQAAEILFATGSGGRAWRFLASADALTFGPRSDESKTIPWRGAALTAAGLAQDDAWLADDDGVLHHIGAEEQHQVGRCVAIACGGAGRVWICADDKVRMLEGGAWHAVFEGALNEAAGLALSSDSKRLYASDGATVVSLESAARNVILSRPGSLFGALALTPAGLVAFDRARGELLGINLFQRVATTIADNLDGVFAIAFDRASRSLLASTPDGPLQIPTDRSSPPTPVSE